MGWHSPRPCSPRALSLYARLGEILTMIQLPHEMRDTLVEQLDEYLDAQSAAPDGKVVAAYVVDLIGSVAEELKVDDADEVLVKMETSGELDASLLELLEEEFESND